MLVDSPRLTDEDRAAWEILEGEDRRRARSPRLARLAAQAQEAIREYLRGGPAFVSVSWGKDSVTVAHLTRQVAPTTPVVHGAFGDNENPDSATVAAEYLARWPMPADVVDCDGRQALDSWARPIERRHGPRRIMGIRAEESGARQLSAAVHGIATPRVCRPILRWHLDDVFAYLALHDLPIHPAYAMSRGGRIDRESLRVDILGGEEGRERGRGAWERHYYGTDASRS